MTVASGAKTTYTYDSRDRTTSISYMDGTTNLGSLNYTCDGVGNVIKINNENYSYNPLNELTSGNGTWGTINYSYDAVGNMVQMVSSSATTTNYSYGPYNRLTSAGNTNYTYNADGDLIREASASATWNYNYDYLNRLTSVVKNGVTVENDTYNGDGQQVTVKLSTGTLVYFYQGTNMLYAKNLTSGTTEERAYANGMAVEDLVGISAFYYQTDTLGSVRLATNAKGDLLFYTDYEPYGPMYGANGLAYLQYIGRSIDPFIGGLYNDGARYYDPSTGRFITEDTYTGSLTDPLSENRYIYAEENPESNSDPTGHFGTRTIWDANKYGYYGSSSSSSTTTTTVPCSSAARMHGSCSSYVATTTTSTTTTTTSSTTTSITYVSTSSQTVEQMRQPSASNGGQPTPPLLNIIANAFAPVINFYHQQVSNFNSETPTQQIVSGVIVTSVGVGMISGAGIIITGAGIPTGGLGAAFAGAALGEDVVIGAGAVGVGAIMIYTGIKNLFSG